MHRIFIQLIVPGSILIPIVLAIIKHKYWGRPEKAVFLFMVISCTGNILSSIMARNHINNLPALHIYTILEFISIATFFYAISNDAAEKLAIRTSADIVILVSIVNIMYLTSIYKYNLVPRSVAAIFILVFCIRYMMRNLSFNATHVPFFPFATVVAFLLYFSGSLTLFALSDYVILNKKVSSLIWDTHATFVLIMYLIIAVGYYKTGPEK